MRTEPRSVGRPREFDTEAALTSALELFWRNGYDATTTRDLEAELGMTQSSIYNAFGSKKALLANALSRYEQRVDAELVEPLDADPGLTGIDMFLTSLTEWITSDGNSGCMLINLMAEDAGSSPDIVERTRAYRSRVRLALRNALEGAASRAELADPDSTTIDRHVELLMAGVLGLNIAARGGASHDEINGLLDGVRSEAASWRA